MSNAKSGQNPMPDDGPSSFDYFFHHYFVGFIHPVDIQIKIIVDDISGRSNQNGRKTEQDEIIPVSEYFRVPDFPDKNSASKCRNKTAIA